MLCTRFAIRTSRQVRNLSAGGSLAEHVEGACASGRATPAPPASRLQPADERHLIARASRLASRLARLFARRHAQ